MTLQQAYSLLVDCSGDYHNIKYKDMRRQALSERYFWTTTPPPPQKKREASKQTNKQTSKQASNHPTKQTRCLPFMITKLNKMDMTYVR